MQYNKDQQNIAISPTHCQRKGNECICNFNRRFRNALPFYHLVVEFRMTVLLANYLGGGVKEKVKTYFLNTLLNRKSIFQCIIWQKVYLFQNSNALKGHNWTTEVSFSGLFWDSEWIKCSCLITMLVKVKIKESLCSTLKKEGVTFNFSEMYMC